MKYYHIDAFTNELFKGNSAGVVICIDRDIEDEIKKKLASEFKHSETAFVLVIQNSITLRWFTPEKEVDLCGHATIAAAFALWNEKIVLPENKITFRTKSGDLFARLINNKIELDFPQLFVSDCDGNDIINKAFGIQPIYTGKNNKRYLIEIDDAEKLRNIVPDFEMLKKADLGGFMITSKSDRDGYDFLSRFFAPIVGIPEDPVTGSAHCYLGPYWKKKLNKNIMIGFQESKRTGVIECQLDNETRIKMRGNCRLLFSCEFSI